MTLGKLQELCQEVQGRRARGGYTASRHAIGSHTEYILSPVLRLVLLIELLGVGEDLPLGSLALASLLQESQAPKHRLRDTGSVCDGGIAHCGQTELGCSVDSPEHPSSVGFVFVYDPLRASAGHPIGCNFWPNGRIDPNSCTNNTHLA
eukprot:3654619-Pyramimonas_sp.AAC.1